MRLELDDPPEEGPNLTSLIDVVFLLLVFFLVATTFASDEVEMDLELPKARTGEAQRESHPIIVHVDRDGSLHVDGRPITREGLEQKLRAAASRDKSQEVLIRGDTQVHLGRVVEAFDACRAASLTKVAIAAAPDETAKGR
ncbi:MAG: biopolymer transporter ExbD [Planctomycetota bacterium]